MKILKIYNSLIASGHLIDLPKVQPIGKFKSKSLKKLIKSQRNLEQLDSSEMLNELPPLLKSYLKVGAKIVGRPALDKDFQCFDFLTLLDFNNANKKYRDKYNK